ncbi:MAG: sulfatase, partial [Candidatus Glassbacteria bacterium]
MKETVENNRTGFLHILPPWIFLAILFASLDLFLRLKALAFVSTVEWLYYLVKVYGIYLLTILFSCILLTFIIRGIKALIPTTFDIQRISLALFISCVFAFIIISETEISITIQSTAKFIGLIVTCIGSAALGMLLSKFIIRFSSLFWVSSIVILLLPSAIYLTSTYDHRHIPDLRQRPSSCPNVLLILIDTLRADHVGCYDQQSPTLTPNMDNFAEDAAIFMDVTSQSSWTKTSVASLMTSQYPSNHGVLAKEDILDSDIPILSSLLRESGILTAAFVGNPWIYPTFGFDRGFSYYFNDFYQLRRVFFLDKMYRREWLRRAPYPDGAKLLNFARQWIEDNRGHPFFVYLHIMDVHDPYIPPPPFDRMYLPAEYKQLKRDDLKAKELEFRKSESPSDSTHLPLVEALYDGGVSYTDSILGEFLDFLDDAGLKDSSLIIITSDHGEEFLEHNGTTHGKTLYEEVLKIPLIMSFPGIPSGGIIVDEPVTLIDVVPT